MKVSITLIILIFFFVILFSVILIVFLVSGGKHNEVEEKIKSKEFVVEMNYSPNIFFRYISHKTTTIYCESDNITNGQSVKEEDEKTDFFLHIREKHLEEKFKNTTNYTWYTGYFGILDMTTNNGTIEDQIIYDKTFLNYLSNSKKKLRNLASASKKNALYNSCFVKINFFESGVIKDIYFPKGFIDSLVVYIKDLVNLVIPQISANLYTNDSNFDEIKGNLDNKINLRLLDEKTMQKIRPFLTQKKNNKNNNKIKKIILKRKLSDDYLEEDYLTETEKSLEVDLRQITTGKNEISNLTYYSKKEMGNEEAKFENSSMNENVHTIINKDGIIQSIIETKNGTLINEHKNNTNNTEYNEKFDIDVYNENNQLTIDDIKNATINGTNNTNKTNYNNNKMNPFDVNRTTFVTVNSITIFDYFSKDDFNQKLYKYYDSFKFKLFNENKYQAQKQQKRIMQYKENFKKAHNLSEDQVEMVIVRYEDEEDNEKQRILEEKNSKGSFYGMKSLKYFENLYNHYFSGLKLFGRLTTQTEPSTGISTSYVLTTFGNHNKNIKLNNDYSNMPKILEKSSKMGYNFLKLLYQSNKELKERNQNFSKIIISLIKNSSLLFQECNDYSKPVRIGLDEIYSKIKNTTIKLYEEIFKSVDQIFSDNNNNNSLLEQIKNGTNPNLNKLRNLIINLYNNYIQNISSHLEILANKTILFFEGVVNEEKIYNNLNETIIDFYFDLVDIVNKSKLQFQEFHNNLINNIEKKFFSYTQSDIGEYLFYSLNELLNITDEIYLNLNADLISSNSKDSYQKLKQFRNIYMPIINILLADTKNDFETQISPNISELKKKNSKYINELYEQKLAPLVDKIRKKIPNITSHEYYVNHLQTINELSNKTISEIISDYSKIYSQMDKASTTINKTELTVFKMNLIDITKGITNIINNESLQIKEYFKNSVQEFKVKNSYVTQQTFYQIKKKFADIEIEKLLNEYQATMEKVIKEHLVNVIKKNSDLAQQVFKEEESLYINYKNKNNDNENFYIGNGFVDRYKKYKTKFKTFYSAIKSDAFIELLRKYFYKVRDNILSEINNKIVFEFGNDFDLVKNEIFQQIENINEFFNEKKFKVYIEKQVPLLIEKFLFQKHNEAIDNIDNAYQNIKSKIKNTKDTQKDFVYTYKNVEISCLWIFCSAKTNEEYCAHYQNIDKVETNLDSTEAYLKTSSNNMIINFSFNYQKYLNEIGDQFQLLNKDLNQYVFNKVNNNTKFDNLLSEYSLILENQIIKIFFNNENNDNFLKFFLKNTTYEDILNKAKKNINYIKSYINLFIIFDYKNLKSLNKVQQYPKEIENKISQLIQEIEYISDNIEETIIEKCIIEQINLFESRYSFFLDLINDTFKFVSINNDYILNSNSEQGSLLGIYLNERARYINKTFTNYTNLLEEKRYGNNIYLLYSTSFSNSFKKNKFKNITNDLQNYLIDFKNIMNENSIATEFLSSEKNKIINSTVIIRSDVSYTKKLISGNIDMMLKNLDDNLLMNKVEMINVNDKVLNNKNIINIYNQSLTGLKNIREIDNILLEEVFQDFIEDFQKKYSYEKDPLVFYEKTEDFLLLKNQELILNITTQISKFDTPINKFIKEINKTFSEQLTLVQRYKNYNVKLSNFKYFNSSYYQLLEGSFDTCIDNIKNLNISRIFFNVMKNKMDIFEEQKRQYFKREINNQSKNYNFELFNMSYDLGEKASEFMEKEYNEFEIDLFYDYFTLIEKHSKNFIDFITEKLIKKKNSLLLYVKIFNNFYNELISSPKIQSNIDEKYVLKNYKINSSECQQYSIYYIDETIKEDNINYQRYLNYTNLADFVNKKCKTNDNELPYKIFIIGNKRYNISKGCKNFKLSNINKETYTNQTIKLLNCDKSDVMYFNNFNEIYSKKLNLLADNFKRQLIENNINDNLLEELFAKGILELKEDDYKQQINLLDITETLKDYEDIVLYCNYLSNENYKNILSKSIQNSIYNSYKNFFDNHLVKEIEKNITDNIFNKLSIYLNYANKTITEEYSYYKKVFLPFNNKIGYNTKEIFINLAEDIFIETNKTINNSIKKYISENLLFLNKINIDKLTNNAINYYLNDYSNDYNIKIFKINEFIKEIILDGEFNKTLEIGITNLIHENLLGKIESNMIYSIKDSLFSLYSSSSKLKNDMLSFLKDYDFQFYDYHLNNNELITKYQEDLNLISKINEDEFIFNNEYNKIYNILDEFIENDLQPSMIIIKDKKKEIDNNLVFEVKKIMDNLPDFLPIIKDYVQIDSKIKDLHSYYLSIMSILSKYYQILYEEVDTYPNKLIHFTYINKLFTLEEPCQDSSCFIKFNNTNTNTKRRLGFKNSQFQKYFKEHPKINLTEIYNKRNKNVHFGGRGRKLEEFNQTMGAITKNDIILYIYEIEKTLYNFPENYLSDDYEQFSDITEKFITKYNNTYLNKLQRKIDIIIMKFLTILPESQLGELEEKLYSQYYNIRDYIFIKSNGLSSSIYNFTSNLEEKSLFTEEFFNVFYNKTLTYYFTLSNLIKEKFTNISFDEYNENKKLRSLESPLSSHQRRLVDTIFDNVKLRNEDIFTKVSNPFLQIAGYILNYFNSNDTLFEESDSEPEIEFEISNIFSDVKARAENISCIVDVNPKIQLSFFFPKFPFLQLRLKPNLYLGFCRALGFSNDEEDSDFSLYKNVYASAEVSMSIEAGFYVPPIDDDDFGISLSVGFTGIISQGTVGLQTIFDVGKNKLSMKLYYDFNANGFRFYVSFKAKFSFIKISINLIDVKKYFAKESDSVLVYSSYCSDEIIYEIIENSINNTLNKLES